MGLEKWSCSGCVLVGVSVRLLLAQLTDLVHTYLTTRIELQTPATSWESVQEGIFLYQNGISPYEGSVFHNQPLLLKFFVQMQNLTQILKLDLPLLFLVLCDVLTGYSVFQCCETYLTSVQEDEQILANAEFDKVAYDRFNINDKNPEFYAKIVTLVYLLNPFTVISCVCKTLWPIEMLLLSRLMLFCLRRNLCGAVMALSLATYLFLFPAIIWVPICYLFAQTPRFHHSDQQNKNYQSLIRATVTFLCLTFLTALFVFASFVSCGFSSQFLHSTWGFHYHIPDMQPNVGLHWYFYMEMFDQYRDFFIAMIHSITLLICIPLCWKFSLDRVVPVYCAMFFVAIYKSYPSFGDLSLCLALVPMFLHYDYSFRPDHVPVERAVAWAQEADTLCQDELHIHPEPFASVPDWCAERCALTEPRLAALPRDVPLVC